MPAPSVSRQKLGAAGAAAEAEAPAQAAAGRPQPEQHTFCVLAWFCSPFQYTYTPVVDSGCTGSHTGSWQGPYTVFFVFCLLLLKPPLPLSFFRFCAAKTKRLGGLA